MRKKWIIPVATTLALLMGVSAFQITKMVAAGQTLTIKGSDTMLIMAQACAEKFMAKNDNVAISVQGGGSGTGISALMNGNTDICNASRPMKASEIQKCKDRGVMPVATTVALDGVAIAINAKNPVDSLTMDQLKDIYTGKVTNWNQVGGNNANIVVLSRESSSGTYVYFQEAVMKKQPYNERVLRMPSTKAIQQELMNNANAIGYGGAAYFMGKKNIKVVPVAAKKGDKAIMPTDDNVRAKTYPLSRPLFMYTAGKPNGAKAQFINFCLSEEGQKLIEKSGYVRLK